MLKEGQRYVFPILLFMLVCIYSQKMYAFSTDVFEQGMSKLPDLRQELGVSVDESKLDKYPYIEITILRNSIFAQYGRRFKRPWLQHHFERQSWYVPNDNYNENLLSPIDRKNAEILKKYEDRHMAPGIPPFYTNEMVLYEGFCEDVKSSEMDRFMFDGRNKLYYEKVVNGKIIDKRDGIWAVNKRTVSYRFSSGSNFFYLQPTLGTHKCNHVSQP